jgi:hypothetical protein
VSTLKQPGRAALPSALVLVLVASFVAVFGSAGAAVRPHGQELALLLRVHVARSAPDTHAKTLRRISAKRPITGERTALPVIGHRRDARGTTWLHVLLPGRPNGHAGWIGQRGTAHAITVWSLSVSTAKRRVTVYRSGHVVRRFSAVVGKPSTPTPDGKFFVEEAVALGPGDVGAPFALALSARSRVFQEFDGGPGQIALHGLANVGGVLGTAASHGCVRLNSAAMSWLVVRIGPGVPVTITAR